MIVFFCVISVKKCLASGACRVVVFHVVFVLNMELSDFNEAGWVWVCVCVLMLQCVGINIYYCLIDGVIYFVSSPCHLGL